MPSEFWLVMAVLVFYLALQRSLGERGGEGLDEAAMLPFADDEEVARRMEQATGRSRTGCACPGTCDGRCRNSGELSA
ncbi:cbb3-type cytochrome c oxidase subunit 3 [Pseudomonas sp. RIT-PI-AD]|uniref:cbb3-type cytochrome c oxidase subunit 3 n=1 Tax=Pseudomonas sp. RIT-PI-AD TaxID=3035294 RepID=UPI0021D87FDA|nr:cbb3-type cytochrome c oxidase subunit 3 [Pseudomonas sp. RIT-PI-AD]